MKKLSILLCLCIAAGFASCQKDDASASETYAFPCEYEEPGTFYVYYRLVNRSGHPVLIEFNEGACDVWDGNCKPGNTLIYSVWNEYPADERTEPPFGLGGFIGFLFDPKPDAPWRDWGPAVYFEEFDVVNCPTPNPGDRTQWTYERLDDLHSRWTYVITGADYQYALEHPQTPY